MSCPICDLDQFTLSHWDVETLCLEMRCRECTAEPEDFPGPEEDLEPCGHDGGDWEIPF